MQLCHHGQPAKKMNGRHTALFKTARPHPLDGAFSDSALDGGRLERADMLMWFWTLRASEVIRTILQAKGCFTAQLYKQLNSLKKELAHARRKAAKLETPGRRRPVTSNRSSGGWDLPSRDLLIEASTIRMISARRLLTRFEDIVSGITTADVLARHEDPCEGRPNQPLPPTGFAGGCAANRSANRREVAWPISGRSS